ncbi:MAG: 2TM domain-containing protein [Leptolyngbya sp. SIO4C1]|nr:2TM domain-containing protein [Leptolyngbya sp. SIO4C1]
MSDLYAAEDAQRILQLAIAKDTESGELSRAQLVEIASELGIKADTLWAAEREWLTLKDEAQEQQLFQTYREQKFQHHLARYSIVNGFLVLIDLLMGGGLGFSLYVALFWGLPLALHAWKTYRSTGYRYQKEFETWRRRRLVQQSVGKLVNRVLGTQASG